MTKPDQDETDEKPGDNSEVTDSCSINKSFFSDEDTQVASGVADKPSVQRPEHGKTVPIEKQQDEPTNKETSVDESRKDPVSRTVKSVENQSTEPQDAEASADTTRSEFRETRMVESPIPAVEIEEPIKRDEYIDRLETTVSELQETVTAKQATVEELRTVTPGLDEMDSEPIATDRYIETLERHIDKLDAEVDRKKSVIQELKNQQEAFRKDVREETTKTMLTDFFTNVREPLVRGTEQIDDIPAGMKTTIVQFDNLLEEYNGEVIEPSPGDEVDRDTHQVRRKEPGNFADGSVKSVEERGLRVAGTVVKQPAVILTEGTPDESHTETDDKPTSQKAIENHDDAFDQPASGDNQDESNADT